MRRLVLALSLAVVACAPLPRARWVPAPGRALGHCEPQRSCRSGDRGCVEQRRREAMVCGLDRARQEAPVRGDVAAFDDLAALALSPAGQCSGDHRLLSDQLVALYPAVHAQVEAAVAAGQIDLAAHRARLLLDVLPDTGATSDWRARLSDVIAQTRTTHQQAYVRLAGSLPGAALYHLRQLEPRDTGSLPPFQHLETPLVLYHHNYQLTVRTAAGCREVPSEMAPAPHRLPGALEPALPVDVEVSPCTEVHDREPIKVQCVVGQTRRQVFVPDSTPGPSMRTPPREGDPVRGPHMVWVDEPVLQAATAWRLTSGHRLRASWRLNGAAPEHVVEASATEQTLELPAGCVLQFPVPLETLAKGASETTLSLAYQRLSVKLWTDVHEATPVRASELRDAARQAVKRGDLDQADHFHQLLLVAVDRLRLPPRRDTLDPPRRDTSDREIYDLETEAVAWFEKRYGPPSRRLHPLVNERFLLTPIGIVVQPKPDWPPARPEEMDCRG